MRSNVRGGGSTPSLIRTFLLFSLAVFNIAGVILASFTLYQVVLLSTENPCPTSDGIESETCSDGNVCTFDVLLAEYDLTGCIHRNHPNGESCVNSCYTSPTCFDGNCAGTCKGNCDQSALECPIIRATNLTSLGFGRDPDDTITLTKTCLLNTCFYEIELEIVNATFDEGIIPEIEHILRWNGILNITNNTEPSEFESDDHKSSELICMGFIIEPDRACIIPTRLIVDIDDQDPQVDLRCTYIFECADPPPVTQSGSIAFPAIII